VDADAQRRREHTACVSENYVVIEAEDGANGLAECSGKCPAIVVASSSLPDANGNAFAQLLHKTLGNRTPPILLLTDTDPERIWSAQIAGALQLPVEPKLLLDTVAAILQKRTSGVIEVEAPAQGGRKRDRRHSRWPVELPVRFAVGNAGPTEAMCANLSLGGMFVHTDVPVPHGQSVRVWLTLPENTPIMLSGIVRWTSGGGIGIQHELLGAHDTYTLSEFLASLR